eukprot:Blabericola_migrator_1__11784@NODE_714_length_6758_cov_108_342251_g492_i1_p1_GENE_NODE_714_length_6758_cov_108_342251_g492_i1NODE_714_length_6758_cov_108_342251_g492_i1_p1_ORF_typecomplete_len465_score51_49DSPc/PF00782_20/3e32CDKN3/PF05706_12/0_00016Init_tRNA_PT/PF04179_12/0_0012Y_phosphatase2/PF03162_13/0_0013PTPlike_phytase/PF14566_6/0_0023DUF442/PF04273_13/0_16Y_phosphatase/PF00102_27/0_14_NODE_714_length_6758_cov_108_342251_g492_i139705364
MSEIISSLYLGGLASTRKEFLSEHNIRALVSCCNESDFGEPPISMAHFRVPVEDISNEPISDYMDDACQFISKHLEEGGVLVHCRSGVSRSATIVIGFLMKTMRLSLNDSFMLVLSRRSIVCPNIGFMKQLCNLEEALLGGGDKSHSESCVRTGRSLEQTVTAPASADVLTSSRSYSEAPPSPCDHHCYIDPQHQDPLPVEPRRCTSSTAVGQPQSEADRLRSLGQALMTVNQLSIYSGVSSTVSDLLNEQLTMLSPAPSASQMKLKDPSVSQQSQYGTTEYGSEAVDDDDDRYASDSVPDALMRRSAAPMHRSTSSNDPHPAFLLKSHQVYSHKANDSRNVRLLDQRSSVEEVVLLKDDDAISFGSCYAQEDEDDDALRTPPTNSAHPRVQSAHAALAHNGEVPSSPLLPSYLTPRNALSCVTSPDNRLLRSIAVKSPSLSMSKYISWYTMTGERATAPSLAP